MLKSYLSYVFGVTMEEFTAKSILWQDTYNIHNSQIDEQHQTLFNIASEAEKIHSMQDENDKKVHLNKVLREVYSYTNFHLSSEEEYMKEYHYPNLEAHKLLHRGLMDKLTFIIANLTIYTPERSESELYYFLRKIFLDHIMTHDIKIAKFISRS
jgi:hemerythrin